MADVIDVIHNLQFNANTSVLDALNAEFGKEIKLINELQAKVAGYEKQLDSLHAGDVANRKIINGLIDQNKAKIDATTVAIGKQFSENKKLSTSVVDATGKMRNLQFAGSQLLREAPAFTYSIQTGILALSNNIPILLDQLSAAKDAGSSTKDIFKALGGSIFSMTGLLTIAVSVLTIFGDKIFSAGKSAEALKEQVDGVTAALSKNIDELLKVDKHLRDAIGLETDELENILTLIKAKGVVNGEVFKSEEEIFKASQNLRDKEQQDLINRVVKYKEVRDLAKETAASIPDDPYLSPAKMDLYQAYKQRSTKLLKDRINLLDIDPKAVQILKKQIDEIGNDRVKLKTFLLELEKDFNVKTLDAQIKVDKKTTEIDAAAIEREAVMAVRRKELNKALSADILDLNKDVAIQRIKMAEEASYYDEKYLNKKLELERKFALDAIDLAMETARKAGALDKDNQDLFNEKRAQVNRMFRLQQVEETRAFFAKLHITSNQFYADQNTAALENSNKQLKLDRDLNRDTLNTHIQIAKEETQVELDSLNKKYEALFQAAKENNIGSTELEKEHLQAIAIVRENERRKELDALEKYFQDELKIIQRNRDREVSAINADGKNLYNKRMKILKADLKKEQEDVAEARENLDRVNNKTGATDNDKKDAKKALDDQITDQKKAENDILFQRIDNINVVTSAYQQATQVIANALNSLYEQQLRINELQTQTQEKRVNQAILLAERGNTEILRLEQERLNKLQQERERIARKQIALNGILQASNSAVALSEAIGAIIKAAAVGDPYTLAARVIAAVAAIVGGIASLKGAFSDDGFAEGVVGYQGKGSGTSDSNRVRISHGESVITAKATAKYRPWLEAMNANKPLYTATLPSAESDYASRKELKELGKKLDTLIEVNSADSTQVNTRIDESGIHQITQRQKAKLKRTWG